MNDTIRCSGHRGHWECADEHPDHIVPIEKFRVCPSKPDTRYRRESMCLKCSRYKDNMANPKKNPLRKISYKLAGGFKKYYSLTREERISIRHEAKRIHLLNTAPAAKVLEHMEKSKKPMFNQGKYKSPLARAVEESKVKRNPGYSREGPGYVYIYKDELKMPGYYKIGSTKYRKGRLPSANTWGAFSCLYEKKFDKRFEAESLTHSLLDDYRVYSDKEWFKVNVDLAIKTIEGVDIDAREK